MLRQEHFSFPRNLAMIITHRYDALDLMHGGTIRFVLDLGEALAKRGHDVLVACDRFGSRPAGLLDASDDLRDLGTMGGRLRAVSRPELISAALHASSIVHFNGVWNTRFAADAAHCRKAEVPYVVSPHGMLDDWPMSQRALKKRIYYALRAKRFLRSASQIHVTAEGELAQSKRWFSPAPATIIPCLIDLAPFTTLPAPLAPGNRFGIDPARPVALFLGRVHPKKGCDVFIEAAALLMRESPLAQFVVAGSGDPAYVETMTQRAKSLNAPIKFIGHIDGSDKFALLAGAAVFVLPTLQENFGIAIVEAIAAGTPAVITKGVDICPELRDAGVAVIADRTADDFANAMRPFLSGPKDSALSAKCREFVFRQYDPDQVASQYESMYARVVSHARSTTT